MKFRHGLPEVRQTNPYGRRIVLARMETVMGNVNLIEVDSHFEFGKNWHDFSRLIDEGAICEAEQGILRLIPQSALRGATFLDIGSGSGLHSLAAHRLGAQHITAIDLDADSVATTRSVLAANGVLARVEQVSVFDMEALGQFDVVYSWGVLHHTGAIWDAVKCAAAKVNPGGILAIALYQKTPLCGAWAKEKQYYTAAPKMLRKLARGAYVMAFMLNNVLRRKNPIHYVRTYKSARGMNFFHDVHDWMGGYPYESSTLDETRQFVESLGFKLTFQRDVHPGLGIFGTGCAEYVFRRDL